MSFGEVALEKINKRDLDKHHAICMRREGESDATARPSQKCVYSPSTQLGRVEFIGSIDRNRTRKELEGRQRERGSDLSVVGDEEVTYII